VLKTKIVAQRLGSHPVAIVVNFSMGEKGEIKNEDIMKMLELPVYGTIPFDIEVRRSFMQQNVQPLTIRKPTTPAAIEMRKVAAKIAGVKTQDFLKGEKKQGFLSRLLAKFKRKK